MGDEVKRGNGFGDVEGLGVGDGGDRDEPDVRGDRRDPRCDEHGIGPARQPPRVDLGATTSLRGERVVEGHEVQQPTFGGDGEVGPVAAAGDGLGSRPTAATPRDASRSRRVRRPDADDHVIRHQPLEERDGIVLVAVGGQRLVEAHVSRGQVERLGLGLLVAGRQVDAAVAAGGDLGFEFGKQRLGVAPPPVLAVGPDALEFGGLVVEAPKCAAGDGLVVDAGRSPCRRPAARTPRRDRRAASRDRLHRSRRTGWRTRAPVPPAAVRPEGHPGRPPRSGADQRRAWTSLNCLTHFAKAHSLSPVRVRVIGNPRRSLGRRGGHG